MNKVELDAQVNKLSVCNVCRSNLPQNTTYNKKNLDIQTFFTLNSNKFGQH